MKTILTAVLLTAFSFCFSQKPGVYENTFSIKINPASLIDVYGGYSVQAGFEAKLYRNIAFAASYGGYYSYGQKEDINLKKGTKGSIAKAEIKMYLNKERQTEGYFVAIEFLNKNIRFNYTDSFLAIPGRYRYEKQYRIYKNIYCASLKYGNLAVYKSRFVFEYYVGLGVRILHGHNTLPDVENENMLTGEDHGYLIGDGQRAIDGIYLNPVAGLKVGLMLGKRHFIKMP